MRHLAFQLPVGADKDVNDQHDFVLVGEQGHNNILYVALTAKEFQCVMNLSQERRFIYYARKAQNLYVNKRGDRKIVHRANKAFC